MRRFTCVVILGGIVGLAGVASAAEDAKDKGEAVFAAQKCGLCHSIAGKGNPKGAMDEALTKLTPAEIRSWITDAKGMTAKTNATRKPAMKEFSLPKGDVDALVAYLTSFKSK